MARNRINGFQVLVFFMVLKMHLQVKCEIGVFTPKKQKFIRTGHNLQINCTLLNKEFKPNFELKWMKVGSHLSITSLRISNKTEQLQIENVKRQDGGEYRCVVMRQARVVNSTSVHVTVADLPSKPSISSWRSINWNICFNWLPVSSTGGLPVTYKLRYRCLSRCELDDDNLLSNGWHEVCKNTLPNPGQEMKCCLDHVTIFIQYKAVVIAENALGIVTSTPIKFSRGIKTTFGPPQSLQARATGYGAITIDWIPRPDSTYWQIKYVILYHAQGDLTKNKTITLENNGQNRYRLTGLRPYTNYTLYVAGVGPSDSGIGIPVGPAIVLTKESNPLDAPEITSWSSKVYPENRNLRNITLSWKLPPKVKWNGKLRKFIIQYRKIANKGIDVVLKNSLGETLTINSSSRNEGVISDLETTSSYEVEMQMCNGAGCGGIGNKVVVNGLIQHKLGEGRDTYGVLILLLIPTAIVLLFFALTILVYFMLKRIKPEEKQVEISSKCYPVKRKAYDRMDSELSV